MVVGIIDWLQQSLVLGFNLCLLFSRSPAV